jgi:hypothetical protein
MKKPAYMSPLKVINSTIKDLNDSDMDEILNNELKRTLMIMIN